MKTFEKVLLALSISFTIFAVIFLSHNPQQAQASVSLGNDYIATSTRLAITGVAMASPQLIATGNGTFGSVTIEGAGTGVMNIYDGTTTSNHTDSATTTLASFPASTAAGTYTFDVRYVRGIVVEIIGSAATSTITYR